MIKRNTGHSFLLKLNKIYNIFVTFVKRILTVKKQTVKGFKGS